MPSDKPLFDPNGSALNDSPEEYKARLDAMVAAAAESDRANYREPKAPRENKIRVWSAEEIAETAARVAEAQAREAAGPQLPPHLAAKRAIDWSPMEADEAYRIMGLPRLSYMELQGQQENWERRHGRG